MSKLFSRTRSAVSVGKNGASGGGVGPTNYAGAFSDTDDFGRIRSVPLKRGKTENTFERARQRTLSNPNLNGSSNHPTQSYYGERPETPKDLPMLPDGLFLSTSLAGYPSDHQRQEDLLGIAESAQNQEYGYLSHESHIILGLDEVVRLVDVVAEQLGQRGQSLPALDLSLAPANNFSIRTGLTTPLLFSPLAIDIRPNVVRKLIAAFIATCPHHLAPSSTEARWREDSTFAGPHELAMLLRWGLARIVRLERGIEVRGFITWDSYVLWRQQEQGHFHFPSFYYYSLLSLNHHG